MHKSICPACGHEFICQGQKFKHNLSRGLVKILMKMAREAKRTQLSPVEINWDGGILQGSELGNYTKLRYFNGLIVKHKENGIRKGSEWIVTHQGFAFLRGEYSVPKQVTTQNGEVIAESDRYVTIKDYTKEFDEMWQKEFIDELTEKSNINSSGQLSLI